MKILVVDDDVLIHRYFEAIFSAMQNIEVSYVGGYENAIASIADVEPCLIFLDINIPGEKNGLGALKLIKETRPAISVIMVSGDSSVDNVKEAKLIGADGFIKKPFSIDKIACLISKYESNA